MPIDNKEANHTKRGPSNKPEKISLLAIRHQSLIVISPKAIAWMISVAACEPLLPPLEMINGIKVASTNTCSNVFLKICMAANSQHFTNKKMISHTTLFL